MTNSERCISRQRPLFSPPGEARADWRIVADVATAMDHGEAFAWRTPAAVCREHARLTAFENPGPDGRGRRLDLKPLIGLSRAGYDALSPVQWPFDHAGRGAPRLFADGVFATVDGRARMVRFAPQAPAAPVSGAFPLALNTGRVRDQWHTMTRTGLAADLCRHAPEPFVEIHPPDAARAGVGEGRLTRVRTASGEAVVQARISDRQRPGSIFMPMHWTDASAPSGRSNPLIGAFVDLRSGQPEFKHTPARISPYGEIWRGFFIDRRPRAAPRGLDVIWRRIPQDACHLHEVAGRGDARDVARLIGALTPEAAGETLTFEDPGSGAFRRAIIRDDRLHSLLFVAPAGLSLPPRDWLVGLFGQDRLGAQDRGALLAGRGVGAPLDASPMVCACLKVRRGTILRAVDAGAVSVEAVTAATAAGSNCGSCRMEIAGLVDQHANINGAVSHAA